MLCVVNWTGCMRGSASEILTYLALVVGMAEGLVDSFKPTRCRRHSVCCMQAMVVVQLQEGKAAQLRHVQTQASTCLPATTTYAAWALAQDRHAL